MIYTAIIEMYDTSTEAHSMRCSKFRDMPLRDVIANVKKAVAKAHRKADCIVDAARVQDYDERVVWRMTSDIE